MMRFLLQQLNLQAFVVLSVLAIATAQDYPIAKPGCLDKCGDLSIPYPFGTTEACYYSYHFWVTCNDTYFNTPTLIWQNSTIPIKKISLLGHMTVMQFVSYNCYYAHNRTTISNNPEINLPRFFRVSIEANKFTIVGCDAYGFIYGKRGNRNYSTGCTASCSSRADLEEGSCMGSGCCQTSIPANVWQVRVKVHSYNNYSNVGDISNCTYGFLVEHREFRFFPQNLSNLRDVEKLPMVLDWAIGNVTSCEEAKRNSTDYACKSKNSHCYKPQDNGSGYRCLCDDGYDGNPYIIDGCRDVDECNPASDQKYPCQHKCVNTPGGFKCPCPKGHRGDGRIEGKGCSRGESHTVRLVAGIALGVILLLLLSCLAFVGHIRRQSEKAKQKWFIQNGGNKLLQTLAERGGSPNMFKIFTSSDLKKATNDFHKDNIVGQGGFGTVYRGLLSDKRTVAIKKSKIVDENQIDQFVNEIVVISQTNHRNIVKLLGCCLETEIPLLVYEFISNGTLYAHLHDRTRASLLTWEKRLRIAAETANVLWYLHSTASIPIIHRDVKSDNILLDHTFTAKVSDFGASRLIAMDQTQISTIVQGTVGYLDPEYLETQQLTTKSDVYSFGVVLLELLTRRKVVNDVGPEGERSLVLFSRSLLKQEDDCFFKIIDGNIVSEENREQLMKVARLAERCLKMSGEERPSMNIVAMELEALKVGIKKSHPQTEQDANVMEPLHVVGFEGIISGGCDSSASAGSDSFAFNAIPPMSGGR